MGTYPTQASPVRIHVWKGRSDFGLKLTFLAQDATAESESTPSFGYLKVGSQYLPAAFTRKTSAGAVTYNYNSNYLGFFDMLKKNNLVGLSSNGSGKIRDPDSRRIFTSGVPEIEVRNVEFGEAVRLVEACSEYVNKTSEIKMCIEQNLPPSMNFCKPADWRIVTSDGAEMMFVDKNSISGHGSTLKVDLYSRTFLRDETSQETSYLAAIICDENSIVIDAASEWGLAGDARRTLISHNMGQQSQNTLFGKTAAVICSGKYSKEGVNPVRFTYHYRNEVMKVNEFGTPSGR